MKSETMDKIKALIVSRYRDVKTFSSIVDIPYSTLCFILKEGFASTSPHNVALIAKELQLDLNALADGCVAPLASQSFASQDAASQDWALQMASVARELNSAGRREWLRYGNYLLLDRSFQKEPAMVLEKNA